MKKIYDFYDNPYDFYDFMMKPSIPRKDKETDVDYRERIRKQWLNKGEE